MIGRIWHGWTAPENADTYESLLRHEIFLGIQDRRIAGFRGIQLLRRDLAAEVEFVTMMWFDSIAAIRVFAEGGLTKWRSFLPRPGPCFSRFERALPALRDPGRS